MSSGTLPTCDMARDCTTPVTHIGEKGYVYCPEHAAQRRGWEGARRMVAWELDLLREGKPLPSYRPIPKPAPEGVIVGRIARTVDGCTWMARDDTFAATGRTRQGAITNLTDLVAHAATTPKGA